MNIVIAGINSKYVHSLLSPWCLKAGVESFCELKHNITIIETTINSSITEFSVEISKLSPDILAIPCYIWNINFVIELSELIKKRIVTKIVLGGPEVAYRSESVLKDYSCIDFVLSGEGEWTFSSLIDVLSLSRSPSEAEGLTYRYNEIIIKTSVKIHKDTPPSPYCEKYFNSLNNRIAYIESSRGCPYKCSYCLSGRLEKMRCFDAESVCENIIKLSNSGAVTIKFIDRTFNANEDHCYSILDFILSEIGSRIPENICFHFEISADILTNKIIELFQKFPKGSCQLEIGIQSYNTDTLNAINRHCNFEKLESNIAQLTENGNIHIHTDLIAGLPYETLESFISSFNRAFRLKTHMLQIGFLKLLSGAAINENINEFTYTFNDTPPYEIVSNKFLSNDELKIIRHCEKSLDKLYNSGRFMLTIDFLLKNTAFSPFELFRFFSDNFETDMISLKELTQNLYICFSPFCNAERLREVILCDLASIDANITIPEILKTYDKEYKRINKFYTEKYQTNVKTVICRTINKVYVVNCDSQKDLRKRKQGKYFDL